MVDDQPASDTFYQTFRVPDEREPVQIPVALHPTLKELYVLWSDIVDCFPRATRVQFKDIYVPKLKDARLYRAKPHGIRYHPEIVLDIIYGERSFKKTNKHRNNGVIQKAASIGAADTVAVEGEVDGIAGDDEILDREEVNVAAPHPGVGEELSIGGDGVLNGNDSISRDHMVDEASFEASALESSVASRVAAVVDEWLDKKQQKAETKVEAVAGGEVEAEVESTQSGDHPAAIQQPTSTQNDPDPAHPLSTISDKDDVPGPSTISTSKTQVLPTTIVDQDGHMRVSELVANRVKGILDLQYSWWNSYPKYFCFLPILTTATTAATESRDTDDNLDSSTKFKLCYYCDCSDITGSQDHCLSHWVYGDNLKGVAQERLASIIPLFGEFIMAVLEMIKYGVILGDVVKVSPEVNPDIQRRLSLAIQFFEANGIQSCEKYVRDMPTGSSFGVLSPLTTPSLNQVQEFWKIARREAWMGHEMMAHRIAEGDVRWICMDHWFPTLADGRSLVGDFVAVEMLKSTEVRFEEGAFGFSVTSLERARGVFLRLSEILPMISILRLSLQWALTLDDERVLAEAIGRLSAAAVDITVPSNTVQDRSDSGLDGFALLITAALQNPKIEAFVLQSSPPDNGYNKCIIDERANIIDSFKSTTARMIALISRRTGDDDRMKATLRVTRAFKALKSVRRMAQGLHNFSHLELTTDCFDRDITITFAASGGGKPGSDVEDTDYNSGDVVTFFESRQWCDEIECVSDVFSDDQFSRLRCLTKLTMMFLLTSHRAKVRELIKMNKGLRALVLINMVYDDPSQIFETFKSLFCNHPSIETFTVEQGHDGMHSSLFTWTNPNDPAKMRVEISCLGYDKVQAMFQRYAPIIERLQIQQLSRNDTAVLEKSLRLKKGPIALRRFTILWTDDMEDCVLNDLKTIILRRDIDEVVIQSTAVTLKLSVSQVSSGSSVRKGSSLGDGKNKSVSKTSGGSSSAFAESDSVLADFLFAVRSKVTSLAVYNGSQGRLFEVLESGMEESLDMPRLRSIEFTRDWGTTLFGYLWFERLLQSKRPVLFDPAPGVIPGARSALQLSNFARVEAITSFHVSHVAILPEEWDRLLQYMDFSQLVSFIISQTNEIKMQTLFKLANAIPTDCGRITKLTVFDGRISNERGQAALSEKFSRLTIGRTTHISVRGQQFY
ncbi:hypothetical protein BGZ47_004869 [Haplosporangium gracile]|nr:hypothetical protein BGZ47_004869 [Haplosporangium gracile]